MSYDIWLEDQDGIPLVPDHNYTYNISPMLRKVWDGAGMTDLDSRPADEARLFIEHAIEMMSGAPEDYDALNPANGWGNRQGCVDWLMDIVVACRRFPNAVFRVG